MRVQRIDQLAKDIERQLRSLGATGAAAYDGWLDATGAAQALRRAKEGDTLLLRAAWVAAPDVDPHAQAPAAPLWLQLTKGDARVRYLSGGASSSPITAPVRALSLLGARQLCCDSPKCKHHKCARQLVLQLEEGRELVVAQAIGAEDGDDPLAALTDALAAALTVPAPPHQSPPHQSPPHADASAGKPLLRDGAAAPTLARWALRLEGEMMVLRDYASLGPRETTGRDYAVMALLLAATLGAWYGAWASWQAVRYERLAVFLVVAVVLTISVYAAWKVARHAAAYRADNEPLLFFHRDRLVIGPWLTRAGGVIGDPEGRFGAALPLREIDRLVVERAAPHGWWVSCHSDHGPIHVGALRDQAHAHAWCERLNQLVVDYRHQPPPRHKSRAAAASPGGQAALVMALLLVGCGGAHSPPQPLRGAAASTTTGSAQATTASAQATTASTSLAAPPATVVAPAPAAPALHMIEDNIPAAMKRARRDDVPVFVEVWAPWCHTCLSMKSFVLPQPTIARMQQRMVFAAVDSDKPINAAFMARYTVTAWPTMLMLDPDGAVLGLWQGAASANELRRFMQDALDARAATGDPQGPLSALLAARRAQAKGRSGRAALLFARSRTLGGATWARFGEATVGLIRSYYLTGQWRRCATLGQESLATIAGAALPTDVSWVLLECAKKIEPAAAAALRRQVAARMARHTQQPPADASVDDRVDALSLYAKLLRRQGDVKGATKALNAQLRLLEAAAKAAPSPETAATFDYLRMNAYLSLGRGDEAVALFRARVQQLPDRYEPAGRLAQTLVALKRYEEAVAPAATAVALSYGPRKLSYLRRQASIYQKLGRRAEEKAALQAALVGYRQLAAKVRQHPRHRAGLKRVKLRLQALAAKESGAASHGSKKMTPKSHQTTLPAVTKPPSPPLARAPRQAPIAPGPD